MNNISEDIKILEELVESYEPFFEEYGKSPLFLKREKIALENLLNRNKELEEKNKELRYLKASTEEVVLNDYVPKSKIKEKIEEIDITIKEVEGNIENSTDEERRYWKKERHDLFMQKYILQELLEE